MPHCRDMKRQEPALRCATGFLILILCLQASLRVTQASDTQQQPNDSQKRGERSVRPCGNVRHSWAHLLTARKDQKLVPIQKDGVYIWWLLMPKGKFKLEDNNTTLVVPKRGLYLVNLKMYYYIPNEPTCTQTLFLKTNIEQFHSSYSDWRQLIKGGETMQCEHGWQQSVTLSRVTQLEKGTKLRVVIDERNYPFIVGDQSTYLSVTRL